MASTFEVSRMNQPKIIDSNIIRGRGGSLGMSSRDTSEDKPSTILSRFMSLIPPANERKKLIPLAMMFFCILFNYTVLRDTKDVLLLTAPKSGAEVIPFIKTYCNLPAAISFAAIYAALCDRMEQRNVFYACVIPFLIFFSAFALIIYPNNHILHPHIFVDNLANSLPQGFYAPLAIVRNWSFAIFYVLAEMWGAVVTSLLFWGFANEVTTIEEAKKYYPLFGLGANVALIFSGQYVRWVSRMRDNLAPGIDAWEVSLNYLMGAVVASGGVLLATYTWMLRNVLPKNEEKSLKGKPEQKKRGMSPKESIRFLSSSKYIRDLATVVVSFGMCINLVEVSWKSKIKQAFPDPSDYSAFMGNFSSTLGTVTLFMMVIGRLVLQNFGWRTAALVTPTMIGVTGLTFFVINALSEKLGVVTSALGTTPLMLAVIAGAVQNILSKSSKYSLFDPCKEMAFIPLDQESRTKGKAAIDVVGNPVGKSGGALIQQILIFSVGSLASATPYLAAILGMIVFFWIKAANRLATQFEDKM
eukprot:CAMPEP_0178931750 /NCGR_PEP_ID=MMETSP0786-20121207/22114_1 /TAXON_ID=186022 /ORGANISM="Thalassionema frauenfeldii, Strain CCMP 1798" /LENGTH=527 /DNA_ID=CAMNT_0020608723 /DNA_START=269 /DNA_END=1852 /DNA_ORIENTATION=+